MKTKASLSSSKRLGAIVVLFAILLPLLITIMGFTVDYAYMQRSRNEIRVVSDLAAKAAADTLARTNGDEQAALAAARTIAANNTVAGKNITLEDQDVVFGRTARQPDGTYLHSPGLKPSNSVQVTARRDASTAEGPVSLFFGHFYNRPTFDVGQVTEAAFRDVEFMLVLDRSISMKFHIDGRGTTKEERQALGAEFPNDNSRWRALDSAITVFLEALKNTPVRERVGLVTFATDSSRTIDGTTITVEKSTLDSPLSIELNEIRSNMDRLNNTIWFGGTNITAGLEEARLHYADAGLANVDKIIICLTDGIQNAPGVDAPSVEATRCHDQGITVHTIAFGEGADLTEMMLTASNGGGNFFEAPDEDSLKDIFRRLAGSVAFISK